MNTGHSASPVFETPLQPTFTEAYNPPAVQGSPRGGVGQWAPVMQAASRQTGVPVEVLEAVMNAESSGNPGALSPVGAIGLMQLMPDTARRLGVNPHDPNQNILGGAKYLRQMHDKFGNWRDAIAAYNAGPDHTEAAPGKRIGPFATSHDDPRYKVWENPSNGGYAETRNYVHNIEAYMKNKRGQQ